MKKKYQSKILEAIHEEALALYEVGAIDEKTMKEFDKDCLVPNRTKKAPKRATLAKGSKPATPAYASPK
jgi:DNA-binding transcriptional regulator YiaG